MGRFQDRDCCWYWLTLSCIEFLAVCVVLTVILKGEKWLHICIFNIHYGEARSLWFSIAFLTVVR